MKSKKVLYEREAKLFIQNFCPVVNVVIWRLIERGDNHVLF